MYRYDEFDETLVRERVAQPAGVHVRLGELHLQQRRGRERIFPLLAILHGHVGEARREAHLAHEQVDVGVVGLGLQQRGAQRVGLGVVAAGGRVAGLHQELGDTCGAEGHAAIINHPATLSLVRR